MRNETDSILLGDWRLFGRLRVEDAQVPSAGSRTLEFYLEALDRDVKKENENPSIGIILCKQANRVVVEYALSRTMSPVMVAQYRKQLIPKEVLQRTFEEYLALPETIAEDERPQPSHHKRSGG